MKARTCGSQLVLAGMAESIAALVCFAAAKVDYGRRVGTVRPIVTVRMAPQNK